VLSKPLIERENVFNVTAISRENPLRKSFKPTNWHSAKNKV
jgi:hypothetical protein